MTKWLANRKHTDAIASATLGNATDYYFYCYGSLTIANTGTFVTPTDTSKCFVRGTLTNNGTITGAILWPAQGVH